MARKTTPNLAVVRASPGADHPTPPRPLGKDGMVLWSTVTRDYAFSDPGSVQILALACAALDRAESCARQIGKEGQMIPGTSGPRSHPLLRDELQNRALCARLIGKLGLDLEPLHAHPGRPGGSPGYGWAGPDAS